MVGQHASRWFSCQTCMVPGIQSTIATSCNNPLHLPAPFRFLSSFFSTFVATAVLRFGKLRRGHISTFVQSIMSRCTNLTFALLITLIAISGAAGCDIFRYTHHHISFRYNNFRISNHFRSQQKTQEKACRCQTASCEPSSFSSSLSSCRSRYCITDGL